MQRATPDHLHAGSISPRKTFLSLLAEPMMGSRGWKSTVLTLAVCPGSLYTTLPVSAWYARASVSNETQIEAKETYYN
jgi:hypothetical protein